MKELEILNELERVSPPPFLFTRIQAKLSSEVVNPMPKSWVYGLAASLMLLLMLNFQTIQKNIYSEKSTVDSTESLSQSLNLSESIQLYHD